MWRIIKFLWTGVWKEHQHSFEVLKEGSIIDDHYDEKIGSYYDCRCIECGEIKRFNCTS